MKSIIKNLLIFLILVATAAFFSCKNDVVSAPTIMNATPASSVTKETILSAPSNLSATQGLSKTITLTWDSVPGAVQYRIYAADSEFASFSKYAETEINGDPSLTFKNLPSGVVRYFKVSAISHFNTESSLSIAVHGSTLATPVITSIEAGEDSTSATVNWWMENCYDSTYKDDVYFDVLCYASPESRSPIENIYAIFNSDNSSALIKGLVPNTVYYYEVIAYTSDKVSEKSERIDAATARLLQPPKPADITVAKGQSTSFVTVSFKLPDMVDIKAKSGTGYERRPVYFKVYRKYSTELDYPAAPYIAYIGSNCNSLRATVESGISSATIYKFDCSEMTTNSSQLIIEQGDETENYEQYPAYLAGYKVSFIDENVLRGRRYDYKIAAYTDYYEDERIVSAAEADYKKKTSSDSSVAENSGWPLGKTMYQTLTPELTLSEDEASYIKAEIPFAVELEDTDLISNYYLVVTRKQRNLDPENTTEYPIESVVFKNSNEKNFIEQINEYRDVITPLPEKNGKYTYSFTLKNAATNETVEFIEDTKHERYITDNLNPLIVENFFVDDGYVDRYEISYTVHNRNTYELLTSLNQTDWTVIESFTADKSEDHEIVFTDGVTSGETRYFKARIKNGQETNLIECGTLGTPEVTVSAATYDSIRIGFKTVNKADKYEISYKFKDDEFNSIIENPDKPVTLEVEPDEYGNIRYELNNIAGNNDAQYAGRTIIVAVNAVNRQKTENNIATSRIETSIIGPAAITAEAEKAKKAGEIQLKWNKIPFAKSYLLMRRMYDISTGTPVISEENAVYWIDGTNYAVKECNTNLEMDGVTAKTAEAKENPENSAQILFRDISDDSIYTNETKKYKDSYVDQQAKLSWGLTFEYIVIPLLETEAIGGSYNANVITLDNSISYRNFNKKTVNGYALGIGLNVTASKGWQTSKLQKNDTAENSSIYVSWKAPALPANETVAYSVYRSADNIHWEKLSAQTSELHIEDECEKGIIYNYLVGISTQNEKSDPTINAHQLKYITDYYSTQKDAEIDHKNINQGWILAQPSIINANKTENYGTKEVIQWACTENYKNSKPDETISGYLIEVNSNDLAGWTELYHYDLTDHRRGNTYSHTFDATSESFRNILTILRDFRHYYRVRAYVQKDDKITYSEPVNWSYSDGENAYVKWGTRQMTDEEIAKSAMMAFAYAFYINDGGAIDFSNISSQFKYGGAHTISGESGSATFSERSRATGDLGLGKYKQYYSFDRYLPSVLSPNGNYSNLPVAVSCDTKSCGIRGDSDNYIYLFRDQHDITVSFAEDYPTAMKFNATLNFRCSDNNDLYIGIKKDSEASFKKIIDTKDVASEERNRVRKEWFPMQIHSDKSYLFKSTDYGWWF